MTTVFDMSHADSVIRESSVCPALMSRMGSGGNQVPLVLYNTDMANGVAKEDTVCKTLCAQFDNQTDTPLVVQETGNNRSVSEGSVPPLRTTVRPIVPAADKSTSPFCGYENLALKSLNKAREIKESGVLPNVPIL